MKRREVGLCFLLAIFWGLGQAALISEAFAQMPPPPAPTEATPTATSVPTASPTVAPTAEPSVAAPPVPTSSYNYDNARGTVTISTGERYQIFEYRDDRIGKPLEEGRYENGIKIPQSIYVYDQSTVRIDSVLTSTYEKYEYDQDTGMVGRILETGRVESGQRVVERAYEYADSTVIGFSPQSSTYEKYEYDETANSFGRVLEIGSIDGQGNRVPQSLYSYGSEGAVKIVDPETLTYGVFEYDQELLEIGRPLESGSVNSEGIKEPVSVYDYSEEGQVTITHPDNSTYETYEYDDDAMTIGRILESGSVDSDGVYHATETYEYED